MDIFQIDKFLKVKVLELKALTNTTFLLTTEKPFDFKAGNFCALSLDKKNMRFYSFCNGEREENLSFLFNLVEGGFLTPHLIKLQRGDFIYISNPFGEFKLSLSTNAFFISTGTGIAPFYSMLKTGIDNRVKLIQGSRYKNELHFSSFFTQILGNDYIPCTTCYYEDTYHGRVIKYILEMDLEPYKEDYNFYICGRSLMVDQVREILVQKDIIIERISSEVYF